MAFYKCLFFYLLLTLTQTFSPVCADTNYQQQWMNGYPFIPRSAYERYFAAPPPPNQDGLQPGNGANSLLPVVPLPPWVSPGLTSFPNVPKPVAWTPPQGGGGGGGSDVLGSLASNLLSGLLFAGGAPGDGYMLMRGDPRNCMQKDSPSNIMQV